MVSRLDLDSGEAALKGGSFPVGYWPPRGEGTSAWTGAPARRDFSGPIGVVMHCQRGRGRPSPACSVRGCFNLPARLVSKRPSRGGGQPEVGPGGWTRGQRAELTGGGGAKASPPFGTGRGKRARSWLRRPPLPLPAAAEFIPWDWFPMTASLYFYTDDLIPAAAPRELSDQRRLAPFLSPALSLWSRH